MHKVLNLYKPSGFTPLQIIDKFREENPEYQTVKLGYAGRLDPMAEGVLLVLVGEENKKRKEYEDLKKEYAFDVLFGVATDTYDVLGKIIRAQQSDKASELQRKIKQILPPFSGKQMQPYPPYSSQPVNGKPLFYWAREGKLDKIIIPQKAIDIYEFTLVSLYTITPRELEKVIEEKLEKVSGNFRQDEIKKCWRKFFASIKDAIDFPVARFTIACSSGTYVRSIANALGEKLGCGAIALKIVRTKAGNFTKEQALHL